MGNPHTLIWEVPLEAPQHALQLQVKLLVLDIPRPARRGRDGRRGQASESYAATASRSCLRSRSLTLPPFTVAGRNQRSVFQCEGSNIVTAGLMLLRSMLMGGRDGCGRYPMSIH